MRKHLFKNFLSNGAAPMIRNGHNAPPVLDAVAHVRAQVQQPAKLFAFVAKLARQ